MPSQNVTSFRCAEVWEEHGPLLLPGPGPDPAWAQDGARKRDALGARPALGLPDAGERGESWGPSLPDAQAESRERGERGYSGLNKGLAFVAKGVLRE